MKLVFIHFLHPDTFRVPHDALIGVNARQPKDVLTICLLLSIFVCDYFCFGGVATQGVCDRLPIHIVPGDGGICLEPCQLVGGGNDQPLHPICRVLPVLALEHAFDILDECCIVVVTIRPHAVLVKLVYCYG